MKKPLDILLDELRDKAEMPDLALLYHLSRLDSHEVSQVHHVWSRLPVDLRRQVIERLMEAAEADFELDFSSVFRMALEDQDAEVRAASIEGLWEDEDVRLVPILTARLREDQAVVVRAAAAASLGRFILLGELEKIRPLPRNTAYKALLAACRDVSESKEVQRRALESLAYTNERAVEDLIDAAYESPDEETRISAVFAMGRSADTRWARHVQNELVSPNPALRCEATRACGELQLAESVPELEDLVEDADSEVQEAALWALGQIGGDKARAILQRACLAEDEALQTAAEAALEELEFLHGDLLEFFNRLATE